MLPAILPTTVRVPITPETRHKIAVGSDLSLLRLENGNKSAHNDNGTPSGGKQLQAAQQQELPLIQVSHFIPAASPPLLSGPPRRLVSC